MLHARSNQLTELGHARKPGVEDDNVTAFLPHDREFGGEWNQRPDLLFQIRPPQSRVSTPPTGYMTSAQGKVLLDPFDHGIRDFPGELPPSLSTEIEGWEVEYYLRKNEQIKPYDLMGK